MKNISENIFNFYLLVFVTFIALTLPARGETYSWQQCLDMTTAKNPDLLQAIGQLRSTYLLEGVAASDYMPQVSASLGGSETNNVANSSTIGSGKNKPAYAAGVTATQNLFNGLQDIAKVRQAKANTKAAEENLRTVKAQVSTNLKNNYEALLYAKNSVKVNTMILKRRQDNLRLVELQFSNGTDNKGDLLLAQAYLGQAEFDVMQAKAAIPIARALLAQALGLDKNSEFEIEQPVPIHDPTQTSSPNFAELIASNSNHLTAVDQEEANKDAITIARSQFYPTLGANAGVNQFGTSFYPNDSNQWTIGLTLTIPLFNGFKDYDTTRSAIATWAASMDHSQSVDLQLIATLKQSYETYLEAVKNVKVSLDFQTAAEMRADIARRKYNNGLYTFQDWDTAEGDLINRLKAFVAVEQTRVTAESAWEQAINEGVIQ